MGMKEGDRQLMDNLMENIEGIDPFDVPIDALKSGRADEDRSMLTERLFEKYRYWIDEQFEKTGAASLIVCDRLVVLASKDRYAPLFVDIDKIEQEHGKISYILTRERTLIEELSEWSDLSDEDYYPTISLYFGNQTWNDKNVFRNGENIRCDFDTGNPSRCVTNEAICRRLSGHVGFQWKETHLRMDYNYYPRIMKVCIKDEEKQRCMEKVVEGVLSWNDITRNPYKLANRKREGFAGRDVMLKLSLRITLDPVQKASSWQIL